MSRVGLEPTVSEDGETTLRCITNSAHRPLN